MKTWQKWLLGIVASIAVVVGMVVLGQVSKQEQRKQEMLEFVQSKEAAVAVENVLKKEDPKAFTSEGIIQTYEVDKNTVEHNPMGAVMFDIIINGNEEYSVGFILYKDSRGDVEGSSTSWSEAIISLLERGME
ncbi:hypothetical protein BU202_06595 [Streptococcus cuniculi]|uniref:DUF1310 family protein n=1 Tax=Streptococcus cuniculi TaxID=1432788 RepID=A0A1Q8E7C2_9STRE|nr:DUF1310 family protein [Streptococcus cuniculi]OLF47694.1 hypothetical protein BU202_06595 [Streptococcus cuniculi]